MRQRLSVLQSKKGPYAACPQTSLHHHHQHHHNSHATTSTPTILSPPPPAHSEAPLPDRNASPQRHHPATSQRRPRSLRSANPQTATPHATPKAPSSVVPSSLYSDTSTQPSQHCHQNTATPIQPPPPGSHNEANDACLTPRVAGRLLRSKSLAPAACCSRRKGRMRITLEPRYTTTLTPQLPCHHTHTTATTSSIPRTHSRVTTKAPLRQSPPLPPYRQSTITTPSLPHPPPHKHTHHHHHP